MDPALREGYETSRRMLLPPRSDVLLRHAPPAAELRPRDTRAVRLRAHRRPDRRRPAPRGHARGAPRRAGRVGGGARAGDVRHPIVHALDDAAARHRAAARRTAHVHGLDAGRLRAGADRAPGRSSWPTWTARRAPWAGSWPRCSAPARHHADLGRLGLAFQLANFIRDVREDRRLDRIYLPAEDRERFGVTEDDLAAARQPGDARADRPRGRARARAVRRRPAGDRAAPASVRPGVRFAIGLYARMLDRVEAAASTCSAAEPACASGTSRAPRWRRCGDNARRCAAPSARRSRARRTC